MTALRDRPSGATPVGARPGHAASAASGNEAERLLALIGDIYDAALDPALWPGVLAKVAAFVGGVAAALYWKDGASMKGEASFIGGAFDMKYRDLYFNKYIGFDPTTTALAVNGIEEPFGTADILPYADFVETRFYKEWVRPQGWVDCVNGVLERSATSIALVGVFRAKQHGLADAEAKRRMHLLSPHMRRAVLIGRTIDLKTAEAASFADAFDAISAGMFLVDGDGRIVHANRSGHAMLIDGTVLRATGGRLAAVQAESDRGLRETLAAAGCGDASLGSRGIAVPLMSLSGDRFAAHVLPLTSGARRRAGRAYAAVAAVFVHKAALNTSSPPEIIAKTYRLTPMELRVLLAVVEIGGVPEVARALGIAETTVKTHLGGVYHKTGARRQADLVRILAEFQSPLLD